MSRAASNFGRTNTAPVAPLTAAQIRECEERLGLVGSGAKLSPTTPPCGRCVGVVGDGALLPQKHSKGVTPPNSPILPRDIYNISLGGVWGMGECGGVTHPRAPYGKTPVGDVGELGEVKKNRKPPKAKKPLVTIIEDTREQTPFTKWPEWVAVESGTCHTGDYTVKGWENCFCIERKSLKDFAGTMLGGYEASSEKPKKRFNRELERMRHYDLKAVVVVASPRELLEFHHNCGMDAHGALWGFATSIFANYGIPVFPIEGEELAARFVADLARHYIIARTKKNFTKEDKSIKAIAEWGF